ILWVALLRPVVSGLKTPTVGVSLLLAVSVEALAVLAAALAAPGHARWLLIGGCGPFVAGVVGFVVRVSPFLVRPMAVARGDHWITGGAVGLAALAAARIASAADVLGILEGDRRALQAIAIGLWVVTMLWLVVLLFAEARWPRPGYDLRRWSTVF